MVGCGSTAPSCGATSGRAAYRFTTSCWSGRWGRPCETSVTRPAMASRNRFALRRSGSVTLTRTPNRASTQASASSGPCQYSHSGRPSPIDPV